MSHEPGPGRAADYRERIESARMQARARYRDHLAAVFNRDDYGFGCVCMRTPEQRRHVVDEWRNGIEEFWRSPVAATSLAGLNSPSADLARAHR